MARPVLVPIIVPRHLVLRGFPYTHAGRRQPSVISVGAGPSGLSQR